jgi:uncharacterized protein (DUF1778 family)
VSLPVSDGEATAVGPTDSTPSRATSSTPLMCGTCVYTGDMAIRTETRDERLQLRLSPTDDGLIRAAAEAANLSLTEFVLQAARSSAVHTLADRDHVVLDADTWDTLEARVRRRGRRRNKTAELFERPSPFEG